MDIKFRDGSRLSGDPAKAYEALEVIRVKHDGDLDPEQVVRAARAKKSPLHQHFEWDDTAAAAAHRLAQARHLIACIVTVVDDHPDMGPIRAYVSIVKDNKRNYASTEAALSQEETRNQVIASILAELNSIKRKYGQFQEFAAVWATIPAPSALRKIA